MQHGDQMNRVAFAYGVTMGSYLPAWKYTDKCRCEREPQWYGTIHFERESDSLDAATVLRSQPRQADNLLCLCSTFSDSLDSRHDYLQYPNREKTRQHNLWVDKWMFPLVFWHLPCQDAFHRRVSCPCCPRNLFCLKLYILQVWPMVDDELTELLLMNGCSW